MRQCVRTFELLALHLTLGDVAFGGLGTQLSLPEEESRNTERN